MSIYFPIWNIIILNFYCHQNDLYNINFINLSTVQLTYLMNSTIRNEKSYPQYDLSNVAQSANVVWHVSCPMSLYTGKWWMIRNDGSIIDTNIKTFTFVNVYYFIVKCLLENIALFGFILLSRRVIIQTYLNQLNETSTWH